MRVLLVWPKSGSFSCWNFEQVCELVGVRYMTPPLGLLTVAALSVLYLRFEAMLPYCYEQLVHEVRTTA